MSKKDDDEHSSLFPVETENDTSCEESPIFRRPKSNKDNCDPETLLEIENQVKTKLNIHDLQEVEIDTGYRKSKFSTLYKILGLLGVGAFGVVVEAVNNNTKEIIAVKIISQENSKALFQTELMEQQVINELQHKNIIIFKRILYSNYHVFIEMEKVNGGTLESFIKNKRKENKINKHNKKKVLEEEIAASIAKDICNGLFLIHKKNFIHRDLKPENILIDEEENDTEGESIYTAKIADFGLSAEVHSNVFHGQDNINEVMGTILFMAPEQATGQRYGKRIDMWALGIIVFQMLTGKHPFYKDGDTEDSYIKRICKTSLDPTLDQHFKTYDISPMAQSFIKRLLARGISDRYRIIQALAHPWITRNILDKPPLTQNEDHTQMEGEIKLRNAQQLVLFLAISKSGKVHEKPTSNSEFISRMNPYYKKFQNEKYNKSQSSTLENDTELEGLSFSKTNSYSPQIGKERESPTRIKTKKLTLDPNYLQRIRKYNCSLGASDVDQQDASDDYIDSQFTQSSSNKKMTVRSSQSGIAKQAKTMIKKDSSQINKFKGSIGINTGLKKQLTQVKDKVQAPDQAWIQVTSSQFKKRNTVVNNQLNL